MSLSHHVYVETRSRLQLAEKLHHMVRFSDFITLLLGEEGSGRSTLMTQVENLASERTQRLVRIDLDSKTDVTGLLISLVDAFGLDDPDLNDNRQRLVAVHKHVRALFEVDLSCQILIDNADFLSDNALELLVGLLQTGESAPHVLMTGLADFEERLQDIGFYDRLEGRIHLQLLLPLDEEESEAFIASLLPNDAELNAKHLKKVIERSRGNLSALTMGVVQLLKSGELSSRSAAFPIPPLHLAGIGIVLLAITGFAVWHYLPSSEPQTDVVAQISVPPMPPVAGDALQQGAEVVARNELAERLAEQEALLQEVLDAPVSEMDAVDTLLAQAEVSIAPAPVIESIPPVAEADESTAVAEVAQVVAPPAPPAPAPAAPAPEPPIARPAAPEPVQPTPAPRVERQDPPTAPVTSVAANTTAGALRSEELMAWPDNGYTLQVLGARSEDSVVKFIRSQQQPHRFYYFRTVFRDEPWHVVVYGQYNTRSAAMEAVNQLPRELRDTNPWARSIASVKADIQKLPQ
ncbi:SPOR domain-containing protein [Nitrincola nitratireducens]|uniref:SPOR domain-containing protein n=1 Tax=Nitrincola nitratireducens TaxID=1229521 RepID=W9V078_9GAMM|nr:AAA family ATPase [Nitrincola nitratireducens]EXJ10336.1 hypothetical protein D791_02664 [Nitrincola nitratireducens]